MRYSIKSLFGFMLAGIALLGLADQAKAMRPCPPDVNCSGAVNIDDLLIVINSWGLSGGFADVNESGIVDIDDLLLVINGWGPCLFNFGPQYPNAEAHQIGLEMLGPNGALTLSQAQYDRIDRDLGLIRAANPGLTGQTHTPAWTPNQLIVGLQITPAHPVFHCMNIYYQMTSNQLIFTSGSIEYRLLTFAGRVNVNALGLIYDALGDVTSAEPNGIIGGENFWVPTDLGGGVWRWNIDDGFLDCFDGCDCHRQYIIDVNAGGQVTLVNYTEWGQSWCRF